MTNVQFQINANNLSAEERRKEVEWDEYFPDDKLTEMWDAMRKHNWTTDPTDVFNHVRKWFADSVVASVGVPRPDESPRNFSFVLKDDKCCLSYSHFEGGGAQIPFERNEESMLYAFYSNNAMHLVTLTQY